MVFHKKEERWGRIEKRPAAWPRSEAAAWMRSFPATKGSAMAPETVRWAWICLIWDKARHGWFRRERVFCDDLKYLVPNASTIPIPLEWFFRQWYSYVTVRVAYLGEQNPIS